MAKRFLSGLFAAIAACSIFGAASAGAATEFGSQCDPDSGGPSADMAMQLSRVTPPAPLKTTTAGVVTSWKVQSAPFLEPQIMAL